MKQSITIMVVDDELMMRKLVEKVLTRDGFQVVLAEDGEEALHILAQRRVEIIISDIKMPRLNGFELLRSVKQQYPNIAVIMMTAYGDTYSVKDALLLGADEYVTKPFQSHEIALIVERTYWRVLSAQRQSETTL
jgi:two-component system response regulator PilR (NtrC family)